MGCWRGVDLVTIVFLEECESNVTSHLAISFSVLILYLSLAFGIASRFQLEVRSSILGTYTTRQGKIIVDFFGREVGKAVNR